MEVYVLGLVYSLKSKIRLCECWRELYIGILDFNVGGSHDVFGRPLVSMFEWELSMFFFFLNVLPCKRRAWLFWGICCCCCYCYCEVNSFIYYSGSWVVVLSKAYLRTVGAWESEIAIGLALEFAFSCCDTVSGCIISGVNFSVISRHDFLVPWTEEVAPTHRLVASIKASCFPLCTFTCYQTALKATSASFTARHDRLLRSIT